MIISPHMLKTIQTSQEKFVEKYVKNIPEIQISEPFKKGKEIHALANYYLQGQDISKLEKSLTREEKVLWLSLKGNKYFQYECVRSEYSICAKLGEFWIGGRIDALVKDKDDNYFILDYKTGQIPEDAKFDFQTMVYLYCLDKILKNYKSLNFVYLGLKNEMEEKITYGKTIKNEYQSRLLTACLQIKNYANEF